MDGNKTDRGKRKLLFNRNANQTGNVEWFENRSWWSYSLLRTQHWLFPPTIPEMQQ